MRQLCYFIMLFLVCQELFLILQNFFQHLFSSIAFRFYHISFALSRTFSFFFERNGEGGIWTLAPLLTTYSLSRGAPSASWVLLHKSWLMIQYIRFVERVSPAERVGFEPTRPCGQTVFKTASLWPLRYLSIYCCLSLVFSHRRRKWYSSTKVFTCQQLFYIFFIFSFSDFNKPWNPA